MGAEGFRGYVVHLPADATRQLARAKVGLSLLISIKGHNTGRGACHGLRSGRWGRELKEPEIWAAAEYSTHVLSTLIFYELCELNKITYITLINSYTLKGLQYSSLLHIVSYVIFLNNC